MKLITGDAKLISLSDKLLTLQHGGFLQATVGPCFCLILRISSAWKTNSSVMESRLMKALSFAGFRWGKGGLEKNSGNGFVILHNCGCGMQADSTEFLHEEMTINCEDCAF